MSIFDLNFHPIQQTSHLNEIIDLAYGLRSAYVELTDALNEVRKACEAANAAAARVGITTSLSVANSEEEELAVLFWKKFLRSLSIFRVMSLKRQDEEIEGFLYPHRKVQYRPFPEPPAFTVENMMKRAEELEAQREFFIQEWALDLFERFVHWGPTLEEIIVPKKVIRSVVSSSGVAYRYMDEVANLDRFFHFLDHTDTDFPDDYRKSPLVVAVAEAMKHGNGRGETDYFKFAGYSGNGRLHLTFKRRDLVSMWEALARKGLIARMEASRG